MTPGGYRQYSNFVEAWDPREGRRGFSQLAVLPVAVWGAAACVVEGRLWVSGGTLDPQGGHPHAAKLVHSYDPRMDQWRCEESMVSNRWCHAAVAM
mmetsp:Transcript_92372/g.263891  ORF Transcript_92372/g.263891 Transcript_92372/m.263891 type:complete len:96 (+) Transcript_92372:1458-1745(+)|eukprot:CAMPEP_0119533090 /NCGR_PEP_ID=MMETSP1344-20130328/46528_1 /TAXON_ID=236787 /ORGANISM="Florenciella parvula, Strain CCMP2471" /LENGTH=95 /DNA_ID=CAMNT_0007573843 /DNA_START=137 /DNA_END=424 /DNA_ORIENTATION=-